MTGRWTIIRQAADLEKYTLYRFQPDKHKNRLVVDRLHRTKTDRRLVTERQR
jgi:hypothetical protein